MAHAAAHHTFCFIELSAIADFPVSAVCGRSCAAHPFRYRLSYLCEFQHPVDINGISALCHALRFLGRRNRVTGTGRRRRGAGSKESRLAGGQRSCQTHHQRRLAADVAVLGGHCLGRAAACGADCRHLSAGSGGSGRAHHQSKRDICTPA
ncbi:hypothetical protein PAJ_2271 [Pantoea ananatis AJ13355]|uniref:Uncharacterized protein n=1 Tax=Pantoea ananatis (strain AJ13355) TaxID=932677 RepID=A0A0H3KYT2_PANAA|nr:hypothetical protein PAJ_2271 [Pantoea ananatis AJ13355]